MGTPLFDTFAKQRGFEPDWLEEFGLQEAEEHEVEWSGKWIRIPYTHRTGKWYDRHRLVPGTGGSKTPKYLSPKNAESRLFNPLHLGPDADYVWFCEGEFDALALINIGVNAVSVGGANAWKAHWTTLFASATVIVGYDNDDAGHENAVKTANQFKEAHVFDRYPEGISDFNEWMLESKDGMMETIYNYMRTVGAA